MTSMKLATENLDTFERILVQALWQKAGIVLSEAASHRIAASIPRHVDASSKQEPLLQTKEALQRGLADEGLTIDNRRCIAIAEPLVPYIAVTDSNLD